MESAGQFHRCNCGKIIWEDEDPKWFTSKLIPLIGKRIRLTFKVWKNKSSDAQRGYFRGVVIPVFARAMGEDEDETYEILMRKFFPTEREMPDGSKSPSRRSYSDLDTGEAEWLHARVRELAAQWYGKYIPSPNEPYKDLL